MEKGGEAPLRDSLRAQWVNVLTEVKLETEMVFKRLLGKEGGSAGQILDLLR